MDLSIVIPTYNERENVRTIVSRIQQSMREVDCSYEILFVDDSTDDTPATIQKVSEEREEVRFVHRESERGLGTAVVEGIRRTNGTYIVVMDADLQHPPELLPSIYRHLSKGRKS